MKYFSMFSGIGGFELGIQRAYNNKQLAPIEQDRERGNRNINEQSIQLCPSKNPPLCVGYSEIDKYSIQTYEKNFGEHKNYGDATKINPEELPDFDLLCGGFPCQTFSIAGKRRGFEDTRGTLFFDIARILKVKRPKIILLENVKGLLSHNQGQTFKVIIQTLAELGYQIQWVVLNSKFFGVPQNRERVFIIGNIRGTNRSKILPFGESNSRDIQNRKNPKRQECAWALRQRDYKDGTNFWGENGKIRKLTPIECERLQGFPDNWTEGVSDTQRYKQLGNAVTVNVIEAIMGRIIQQWN